jgi:hypothetical protein
MDLMSADKLRKRLYNEWRGTSYRTKCQCYNADTFQFFVYIRIRFVMGKNYVLNFESIASHSLIDMKPACSSVACQHHLRQVVTGLIHPSTLPQDRQRAVVNRRETIADQSSFVVDSIETALGDRT